MSLYLKYRPKTIEELDLSSVREALLRVVKSGQLSHAYLFTGPRGAGKTSAARILARVANCEKNNKGLAEPCNTCLACEEILTGRAVDVLEIDAASNRGIDDVRELKEKIGLAPARMRRKVYIIDEVHMMTTEAFNALLKTLEEPPGHALFILCTTEAHKVPETIESRCSRVLFTKASNQEMLRSLGRVVKGEGAKIEKEALDLLASSVDGSFRDGVKILEQVTADGGEVGIEEMEKVLTGASGYEPSKLVQALVEKDLSGSLAKLREGVEAGVELSYLTVRVMTGLRDLIVEKGRGELVELVNKLDGAAARMGESPVPSILLEMVVVEWCGESANQKTDNNPSKPAKPISRQSDKPELPADRQVGRLAENTYKGSGEELWQKMLASLNGDSYSLGALLSRARPGLLQGDELVVEVAYEFHREQMMQEKHRARIEALVSKVVGSPMRVRCEVVAGELKNQAEVVTIPAAAPEEQELMAAAEEIFS